MISNIGSGLLPLPGSLLGPTIGVIGQGNYETALIQISRNVGFRFELRLSALGCPGSTNANRSHSAINLDTELPKAELAPMFALAIIVPQLPGSVVKHVVDNSLRIVF
jgi:hypothetical protein